MPLALPDDLHSDVSTAGDTFTLRVVSGNGQAARAGSALPEAVVFEADGLDGNGIVEGPIVFSTLAGPDTLAEAPRWTDEDGKAALQVVAAHLPQNQLVAAAVPGVGVVVSGSVSALSPAGFQSAVDEFAASTIEGLDHARRGHFYGPPWTA
jgi:hypothetical protein